VEWIPKILHEERKALEAESRAFYSEHYPGIEYCGIKRFEPDPDSPSDLLLQKQSAQPFYYPVHFVEPVEPNVRAIEFDLYSSPIRREVINLALDTWKPAISKPFKILQQNSNETAENSVLLMHPGIPLTGLPDLETKELALLVIQVKELLKRATRTLPESLSVFLYDSSDSDSGAEPDFLIAAELYVEEYGDETEIVFLDDTPYSDTQRLAPSYFEVFELQIASAQWRIAVVALEDTFEPNTTNIYIAGMFILVASLCLALCLCTTMRQARSEQEIRRRAQDEKASMIVQSAKEAARVEQELNDYIAHEVRNPLAAAMSACTFVKSALEENKWLLENDSMRHVQEDVAIIDSSQHFINDLLRSMLDMHKAASKKLQLELAPVDLMNDILRPVATMLYHRNSDFEVVTECAEHLAVITDRLRLKQIILNLGRNATKFVRKGYIKLGATAVDGKVRIFVEDSGPGIPVDKRKSLFSKFQESLDSMNQGTGMGLCLCKHMTKLLNGDIRLDESFHSGVEGYPGTRFVIDLNVPPMAVDQYLQTDENGATKKESDKERGNEDVPKSGDSLEEQTKELPGSLSLLFVDDDMILRKLFTRSVRKIVQGWNIQEASNGETAVRMCEDQNFDVIFIDQYMASVEKQMLGTETTRALRAKGVTSRICGLSANDVEQGFLNAGADLFMIKPLPCQADLLRTELFRILHSKRYQNFDKTPSSGEHSQILTLTAGSTSLSTNEEVPDI
jgi:signal transduction histidine kinase